MSLPPCNTHTKAIILENANWPLPIEAQTRKHCHSYIKKKVQTTRQNTKRNKEIFHSFVTTKSYTVESPKNPISRAIESVIDASLRAWNGSVNDRIIKLAGGFFYADDAQPRSRCLGFGGSGVPLALWPSGWVFFIQCHFIFLSLLSYLVFVCLSVWLSVF